MTTPIREMIDANPTSVVFQLGVNPSSTSVADEDVPVAAQVVAPVNGFLANVQVEGEGSVMTATITVAAEDAPDGVKTGETQLVTSGGTYIVRGIRERRWLGDLDGYTYTLG